MWIIFALLNPITEGFRSLFIKKTSDLVEPVLIAWINNLLPALLFGLILFFIDLKFNNDFWIGLIGGSIIYAYTNVLYMKAIANGDISTVMPMLSFTPLFLLVTSPIIIGEFPHTLGMIGVVLVVFGSYLLNLSESKKHLFEPFRALVKNKGTRYMLIVAFLWSISSTFDKLAVRNSSILQYLGFTSLFIFFFTSLITIPNKKFKFESLKQNKFILFRITFVTTLANIFHMTAISLAYVAYVIAIKRTTGIISVFLGSKYLNETNIKERLLGVIVMLLGVILIVLS
jgi:uncharacterized membrane protein